LWRPPLSFLEAWPPLAPLPFWNSGPSSAIYFEAFLFIAVDSILDERDFSLVSFKSSSLADPSFPHEPDLYLFLFSPQVFNPVRWCFGRSTGPFFFAVLL